MEEKLAYDLRKKRAIIRCRLIQHFMNCEEALISEDRQRIEGLLATLKDQGCQLDDVDAALKEIVSSDQEEMKEVEFYSDEYLTLKDRLEEFLKSAPKHNKELSGIEINCRENLKRQFPEGNTELNSLETNYKCRKCEDLTDEHHESKKLKTEVATQTEGQEEEKSADIMDVGEKSYAEGINVLNDDCLLHVFSYLSVIDRIRIERVSKRWKRISLESWKEVQKIHIRNDFKVKSITLNHVEEILRRSGNHVTNLSFSHLNRNFNNLPPHATMVAINKYCKKLTNLDIAFVWMNENDYLKVLDVGIIKKLKSLYVGCEAFNFCDEHLPTVLKNAVNLKTFFIMGYNYSGENRLLNLSPKCKTLVIVYSEFSDKMLTESLEKLPKLKKLEVSDSNVTLKSMKPFAEKLECIKLSCADVRADLESLKLPNLIVLDLDFIELLTGKMLSIFVENCPLLQALKLQGAKGLSAEDFNHLKKLKDLAYLDASETKISDAVLLEIAKEPINLGEIFCYNCVNITQSGLEKVVNVSSKLESLGVTVISKKFINAVLASLEKRTTQVSLTIFLKTKINSGRIPDFVKEMKLLKSRVYQQNSIKSSILKITVDRGGCECDRDEKCTCPDHEESTVFFS